MHALSDDDAFLFGPHSELALQQSPENRGAVDIEQLPVDNDPVDTTRIVEMLATHAPVDVTPRNGELVDAHTMSEMGHVAVRGADARVRGHLADRGFVRRLARTAFERPPAALVLA